MPVQTAQCRVSGGGGEGGGGGMRTVECLRGRLLAERVASKAAKEEADQLAKRLDELEKKLLDEVKVRNRAERRLRKAIKKLESLKILDVELSDGSIGSLSSNGRSGHQAPEVEVRNSPGSLSSVDSTLSGPPGDGDAGSESAGVSSAGSCTTQANAPQDGSSCSVLSELSPAGPCKDLGGADDNRSSEESAGGDHDSESSCTRQHSAESDGPPKSEDNFQSDDTLALVLLDPQLVVGADDPSPEESKARTGEFHAKSQGGEEEEENKLAIVLVDPQPPRHSVAGTGAPKAHGDVESVLLALRRAKEQLLCTIERRSELVAHRELCGH